MLDEIPAARGRHKMQWYSWECDVQILAMASKHRKDALRLVHTGSMTTFSNWPTSRSPLNLIHSMAFSPNGGYFAAGNSKGKVVLYRLHHYQQAWVSEYWLLRRWVRLGQAKRENVADSDMCPILWGGHCPKFADPRSSLSIPDPARWSVAGNIA